MTDPQQPYSQPQPGAYPPPGAYETQPQGNGNQSQGYGNQPQGYGTPPAGYGAPHGGAKRNGFGVAALVLGILAVVSCWTVIGGILLGLLAIVFGVLGRGRAKRGEADNRGLAVAGAVLGLLGLLASIALVAVGVSLFNSPEGQRFQDCVRDAGNDQAKAQQCQVQFQQDAG